ncbi:hypothetical protein E2C01_025768 [Portunus trituberculatus]|uniref:Uncharacterized protein n=1 Tax=Portunus trituberculatus TaxID=210409 RepID=A0A5B7EH06_PORTR|nr:hypothetical protein [Portunus trituberculatus]
MCQCDNGASQILHHVPLACAGWAAVGGDFKGGEGSLLCEGAISYGVTGRTSHLPACFRRWCGVTRRQSNPSSLSASLPCGSPSPSRTQGRRGAVVGESRINVTCIYHDFPSVPLHVVYLSACLHGGNLHSRSLLCVASRRGVLTAPCPRIATVIGHRSSPENILPYGPNNFPCGTQLTAAARHNRCEHPPKAPRSPVLLALV